MSIRKGTATRRTDKKLVGLTGLRVLMTCEWLNQLLSPVCRGHLPIVTCWDDSMDAKGRERGILRLEPRPRVNVDTYRYELTPQGSCEQGPSSPHPSVDRLSVTWADPGSMTSGVNLFHLPSEAPLANEVKFSPTAGDGSEDEDYSASLSAVLRQRRASVRRSRKGRARRPSSPFLPDENRPRRRSSVFTTSSGDTAISIEEGPVIVTQEQIFENIHLHKEVLGSVKQQPLGMRRKLKIVNQAKGYIKRHEGQLQERLAQSKSTRDIYARFNILIAAKWQQLKREAANTSNLLIPWELRIKEIESHFGSVVASYFTFLRWLFWVNLVIGFILLVFVIVPEYLTANPQQDGERKIIMKEEQRNATNLLTLWEFEGVLKFSPIFYGYYSNIERPQYRMPLAYFLTGLAVYIYSFVAILRKMAENSRMSKLSEKEDECIFSWKLFTGWDFMIGNTETAHNRIASVTLGFKEALLEEAEKKKDLRNWRIISLRALVNICVVLLLAVSAYAVVHVVSKTDDNLKVRSWWRENETTIVVTVISITFPVFFELLGLLEHYHPRKQLRLQLARIMLLNLLNLYSLIFALFSKIEGMSNELNTLKPTLGTNITLIPENEPIPNDSFAKKIPLYCIEELVPCGPCTLHVILPFNNITQLDNFIAQNNSVMMENLVIDTEDHPFANSISLNIDSESADNFDKNEKLVNSNNAAIDNALQKELEILKSINNNLTRFYQNYSEINGSEYDEEDEDNYDFVSPNFGNSYDFSKNLSGNYDPTLLETSTEVLTSTVNNNYDADSNNTFDNTTNFPETTSNITTIDTDPNELLNSTDQTSVTFSEYYFGEVTDSTTFIIEIGEPDQNPPIQNQNEKDINHDVGTTPSYDSNGRTLYGGIATNTFMTDEKTLIPNASINDISTISTFENESDRKKDSDKYLTDFPLLYTTENPFLTTFVNISECPVASFNCSITCGGKNITQVFNIYNCTFVKRVCYETKCDYQMKPDFFKKNQTNVTAIDIVYTDENNVKQYNLTVPTRKKLLKLCWETMFGQELIKLTMMDLVFVLLGTLFMDFFRALFVRYLNRCWCWDLEKKFPNYGDFKIAENILHLINNQGMVWMGMFFSPGLVVLNVVKLMIMMYLRSWAVMTCNVPHEVVFRVSKSNNFYLALLLTMLFLCVLPVGYTIVWVKPSWHCGPFSEYDKIYYILTNNIYKILPKSLNFALEYIASPAIVIPLLVLLILIIYYLTSLTNSLREANNDLKIQLRRERTEERRKMFQLADTRRRVGSSAMDNTPFARWKKALPSLPLSKSIDSDDRKTIIADENMEPRKTLKKKGGIFAKIVSMALDKKSDVVPASDSPGQFFDNKDEKTEFNVQITLPLEMLPVKSTNQDSKKKNNVEFKADNGEKCKRKSNEGLSVMVENIEDFPEKDVLRKKHSADGSEKAEVNKVKYCDPDEDKKTKIIQKISRKQTSESSTQSKQSDSIGSVIPVIMISTTESEDEVLQTNSIKKDTKSKEKKHKEFIRGSRAHDESEKNVKKCSSDSKSLKRQNSVDSVKDQNSKQMKPEEGPKYQYSL